jgi:hypothetical protein
LALFLCSHNQKKNALKLVAEDEELGDSSDEGRLRSLLDKYESSGGPDNRSAKLKRSGGKGVVVTSPLVVRPPPPDKGIDHITPPQTFQTSKVLASLKAMNAPSELRQATALLLQSSLLDEVTASLLTRDILDQPMEGGSPDAVDDDGGGGEEQEEEKQQEEGHTQSSQIDPIKHESLDQLQILNESAIVANNDAVPPGNDDTTTLSEVPYLFAPPSVTDEMLRPSIFTMHSMSPDSP